jgi:hypothetical protein
MRLFPNPPKSKQEYIICSRDGKRYGRMFENSEGIDIVPTAGLEHASRFDNFKIAQRVADILRGREKGKWAVLMAQNVKDWRRPNPGRKRARVAPDVHAARELELYIDNDPRFSRGGQGARAHRANILRKLASGKYDHRKAWKLWMYLVDAGAKAYAKDYGGHFDKPTRERVAKTISYDFMRDVKLGNWSREAAEYAPKGRRKNPEWSGKLGPLTGEVKRALERSGHKVRILSGNSAFAGPRGTVLRPSWSIHIEKGAKSVRATFPQGEGLTDAILADRVMTLARRLGPKRPSGWGWN